MATDSQKVPIPPAAANHQGRRLQISGLSSRLAFPPSPSNPGGALRCDPKIPQNGVIKMESDEFDNSISNFGEHRYQRKSKVEIGAGTGTSAATGVATRAVNRLSQTSRAGRLNRGDGPGNPIEISDNESGDEQQSSGPRCPAAPTSPSRTPLSTNPAPVAEMALAACQPEQASSLDHTTSNNTALAADAASLVSHKAARPDEGCQRNSRPFAERRAASSWDKTRQKLDGHYRPASHDRHDDGHQRSSSARHHPPAPARTGEPTKNNPARLPQAQGRRASPFVLPGRRSTSGLKPADAEPPFKHQNSPSAAPEHGVKRQHRSGSSALSQHLDRHRGSNQTNDLEQGDAHLPGDREEQDVGSPVTTSHAQASGPSIPTSLGAVSNKDSMLANVGPSANQNPVKLQHNLGRPGTDVGEDQRLAKDSVGEHGRGDVVQPPPSKRRRLNTWKPAVDERAPEWQADAHRASSQSQRAQRPTPHHATPRRGRRKKPNPRSSGLASQAKKARSQVYEVEEILGLQLWYLVQLEGYGHEDNTWEPGEHFDPQVLWKFYGRSAATQVAPPRVDMEDSLSEQRNCLPWHCDPKQVWQCYERMKSAATQVTLPRPAQLKMTEQAPKNYHDVEDILDIKVKYLVKWKGYGHKHSTWEPPEHFDPRLVQEFHEENGSVEAWITREIRDLETALQGYPPYNRECR